MRCQKVANLHSPTTQKVANLVSPWGAKRLPTWPLSPVAAPRPADKVRSIYVTGQSDQNTEYFLEAFANPDMRMGPLADMRITCPPTRDHMFWAGCWEYPKLCQLILKRTKTQIVSPIAAPRVVFFGRGGSSSPLRRVGAGPLPGSFLVWPGGSSSPLRRGRCRSSSRPPVGRRGLRGLP